MFMECIRKAAEELVMSNDTESEERVAKMIMEFVKETGEIPTLISCMDEIIFHNTQIIDSMIAIYQEFGEGYVLCSKPKSSIEECGCCSNYSACFESIMSGNILPHYFECIDEKPLEALVFGALSYSSVVIKICKSSYMYYSDFVDYFDSDNQMIIDNMCYTNDEQVIYANHSQTLMFPDLYMGTPGSLIKYGGNMAIMYDSFGNKYKDYYLEDEKANALTNS